MYKGPVVMAGTRFEPLLDVSGYISRGMLIGFKRSSAEGWRRLGRSSFV